MASLSVTNKHSVCQVGTTILNAPIEKIQNFESLDLEPFEKNSIWSDEYLSQLNIQLRPFDFQIELVQSVINLRVWVWV